MRVDDHHRGARDRPYKTNEKVRHISFDCENAYVARRAKPIRVCDEGAVSCASFRRAIDACRPWKMTRADEEVGMRMGPEREAPDSGQKEWPSRSTPAR